MVLFWYHFHANFSIFFSIFSVILVSFWCHIGVIFWPYFPTRLTFEWNGEISSKVLEFNADPIWCGVISELWRNLERHICISAVKCFTVVISIGCWHQFNSAWPESARQCGICGIHTMNLLHLLEQWIIIINMQCNSCAMTPKWHQYDTKMTHMTQT